MSEAEDKEVVATESAQVVSAEPTVTARKADKFAERRAELKRLKRVAHRRRIAASNTPG